MKLPPQDKKQPQEARWTAVPLAVACIAFMLLQRVKEVKFFEQKRFNDWWF